jgi:hypothetical protein
MKLFDRHHGVGSTERYTAMEFLKQARKELDSCYTAKKGLCAVGASLIQYNLGIVKNEMEM